jgi:hypothetical protein
VSLKATTEDETGQTATIEEVITVDVIPRVTRLADPYYRLPSWVRLTFGADGRSAGGQIEVSGSGPLGGDTGRNLSYVLRQASLPMVGRYASRNEYWLTYRGRRLEVNLGDRVFSLSPLVQRFYYGTGAGAATYVSNVAFGAYYARSRSDEPRHREAGGFVSLRVRPGLSFKANVLDKEDVSELEGAGSRHRIGSLQANYAPTPNARLEFEYGVDAEDETGNDGYRFAANGVLMHRLYFSLEKVHAGPRFHGYTTDSDFALGTFQYPVQPGLTLRASYRSRANNLERDPVKLTAPNERQVTAGVSYIASPRTRLSLDFQSFSRWDALDVPTFDFGERTLRASVDWSLPGLTLYMSAEQGYSQNDLIDLRTSLGRYSVSASVRPSERHSYNIYAGFGNSRYSEVPRKSDDLGVAARWHLTPSLDMNLNYHMSGAPSLVENMYRILTYSVYYTLPNRHMVTLRTSVWGGREGRQTDGSVFLSYSIPAPIPTGRRQSVGTLKGRVYDAEGDARKGIPNVIVTTNGQAAVTDHKGNFEFPSLEPGVYSLQIDAKSIGLGRVTEGVSPFVVSIEGGKTSRLDIGVVQSCTISGEVIMFDAQPTGADSEDDSAADEPVLVGLGMGRELPEGARGLADVLVEITDGDFYLTNYTDAAGEFRFTGLRPGRWTVRVYPEDLPHYYRLEESELAADMTAGEETGISFRIIPRERRINIMDQGEIKQEPR